jgi:hypothetical protein
MANQVDWEDLGFLSYSEDDVTSAGTRNVVYRSQAFPKEIFNWLTTELEEARIMDLLHKKVMNWMASCGYRVEPLEYGCSVGEFPYLVSEFQYQRTMKLFPWVQRPRMEKQDFFVIANKNLTECFLIRSDAPFKKGSFYWNFDESDAKRRIING